jgi:hypothetical protein
MALYYDDLVKQQTPAPTGQAISLDQMQPETPIQLPKYDYSKNSADSLVASLQPLTGSLDTYIQALTPKETQLDQSQNAIIGRINELLPQSGGRQQAAAKEQQNQGIPQLQRQLQDLNNQINIGNAEYAKLAADSEARKSKLEANSQGITTSVLTGQQGAVERQFLAERAVKAAEQGMRAAQAQAVSGNINTAIQLAQSAVDAKYAPIEDELKIRQAQLQSIQPLLDKQQKQQAQAAQVMLQDRQNKIEAEKEKEKQINQIMVQAAQFGADQQTLNNIQRAGSVGEAIKNSGNYLSAEFRQKVEQQKFENNIQLQQLAISRANLALAQRKQKLEEDKSSGLVDLNGQPSKELVAFAQQYASSGQIPPGIPEGSFGLISEIAKSLPKENGTLVDKNTNVKSGSVAEARQTKISSLYDVLLNKIPKLQEAYNKLDISPIGRIGSTFNTTEARQQFRSYKQEILSLILQARSGATVNPSEYDRLLNLLPGEVGINPNKGNNQIVNFARSLQGTLNTELQNSGLSIYGYSKVTMPDGKDYKVGDNIEVDGQKYRINPDGSLLTLE